ncbi:MAG: BON domain-containing protein [Deltaproteobacteria bacterium]|nr:BON domain-containing protein [Deltaproteobacteria bacterium]
MANNDPIKAVKAALTDLVHIDLKANPIHCTMENGSVLLEGTVEHISQKKRALFHAMGVPGVEGVIDRLRVKPAKQMGDDEIKRHMEAAIASESSFQGFVINMEVNDGVIDLEGTVGSLSHKRLAGALAWWIPGAADVINSLEVSPPEDDNDGEVADALRMVLEKDKTVGDAGEISITVVNWVVVLHGLAEKESVKQAAEDNAWYIWGVNDVVNNIKVQVTGLHRIH